RRVHSAVWAIAGATAALAGVLIIPFGVLTPLSLSGFQIKSLAAALVGGFASLPAALAGGLGLGVVQEMLVGAPAPLNGLSGVLGVRRRPDVDLRAARLVARRPDRMVRAGVADARDVRRHRRCARVDPRHEAGLSDAACPPAGGPRDDPDRGYRRRGCIAAAA